MEEFATGTPHLKIAAGNEPLAFGSLLDTNEAEDLAITAKPMIEIAKERKWDEESDEVEEEKEETEEGTSGGWRPGLDETLSQVPEPVEAAPDWRDEAFHGSAPASSFPAPQWTSTETQPSFAEAAESHAVAVATVEHKPVEEAAPFAGDAWAAAMAAGVEDKVGEVQGVATEPVPEVASLAQEQVIEPSDESAAQVQESAPVGAQAPVVEYQVMNRQQNPPIGHPLRKRLGNPRQRRLRCSRPHGMRLNHSLWKRPRKFEHMLPSLRLSTSRLP